MSSDPSSKELVPTVKDFAECDWKEALAEANREGDRQGYILRQLAFSNAAKQAIDEDRRLQGKVLTLLSDVCSMMLSPDSDNEPFKPYLDFRHSGGECSMIPDDLSETDLSLFAEIVGTIDDPWLKARLADLVWLRKHPREVRFALDAVDAYRSIQLDGKILRHDVRRCWERAIRLARMLGKGADDRLKEMERNRNKKSLNIFIYLPETDKIFGENVSFDIQALFCEPVGPNLRNKIAHGLLDNESCHSVAAIYAWWYALKLVFGTFWNALHKDTKSNESEG